MRVFDFPTCPVSKQLFHVPGGAIEGGYTSGAVRILSPEPGGRSVLELQISMQVREWEFPIASWLMSKGNGEVFRVRLAPTPQVLSAQPPGQGGAGVPWQPDTLWSNNQPWDRDITASYAAASLEGSNVVKVNMTGYGDIARQGHVIGHGDSTYIIDEIAYDTQSSVATMVVKPPLRRNVTAGDPAYFRPYFTGTIGNISEVRATYDAESVGHIQPGKFIFAEAIV